MATLSNAMKLLVGTAVSGAMICAVPSTSALAEPTPAAVPMALGCYPAAQVRAELQAEGMQPVIVGNRVTTRTDRPAHYFTSNARGQGYEIEGDQPYGTPATTMCVRARIEGIRLNDINSPDVPSWAMIGNDTAAAERNCRETGAGMCSSHDDYIRGSTANGQRVMLVANTVFRNPDGSTRYGRMITVLTQVEPNVPLCKPLMQLVHRKASQAWNAPVTRRMQDNCSLKMIAAMVALLRWQAFLRANHARPTQSSRFIISCPKQNRLSASLTLTTICGPK